MKIIIIVKIIQNNNKNNIKNLLQLLSNKVLNAVNREIYLYFGFLIKQQ